MKHDILFDEDEADRIAEAQEAYNRELAHLAAENNRICAPIQDSLNALQALEGKKKEAEARLEKIRLKVIRVAAKRQEINLSLEEVQKAKFAIKPGFDRVEGVVIEVPGEGNDELAPHRKRTERQVEETAKSLEKPRTAFKPKKEDGEDSTSDLAPTNGAAASAGK